MLSDSAVAELEKQQYRVVGENRHSAVKVCGWTKNMIRGKGGCYKLKFYGIMSNQCMQATTSISCANRCTFCWRGYKAPVSKEWKWGVDDPNTIVDGMKKAHHSLLQGFAGSPKASKHLYDKSKNVKHVALSLTGEPLTYPRFNEAVTNFHNQGISTFVVTNAQYPEAIKNMIPVTQLYISVDAPNKKLLKEVDVPLFSDYWERLLAGLDALKAKKHRTTIRLTLIKDMNMVDLEGYRDLILRGDPDFIEIKGYMFIGASRQRLSLKNMPYHDEVREFSEQMADLLDDYEIASEHKPSRVVLLAKKKYYDAGAQKYKTWIDYGQFNELWARYPSEGADVIDAEVYGARWTGKSESAIMSAQDESIEEKDLDAVEEKASAEDEKMKQSGSLKDGESLEGKSSAKDSSDEVDSNNSFKLKVL